MKTMGIAVRIASRRRPEAHVVVLDGSWNAPTQIETFALTSAENELAAQLSDLATGLRSRIRGLKPGRVVIRRADRPPKASHAEGPKVRLLAEGALAVSARAEVDDVVILTGRELASKTPAGTKPAVDAHAAAKLPGLETEAAAAAVAGLAF